MALDAAPRLRSRGLLTSPRGSPVVVYFGQWHRSQRQFLAVSCFAPKFIYNLCHTDFTRRKHRAVRLFPNAFHRIAPKHARFGLDR